MTSDSYTVKELLQEVRQDNKNALTTQSTILATLVNIDDHLGKLNSKVATHEKRINDLSTEHTKTKAFATAIMFIGGAAWSVVTFVFK